MDDADSATGNPWSGRALRLKYPPTIENVASFAADIAHTVHELEGVVLDYSPASLQVVDGVLDGFWRDNVGSDALAETLWSFGCYTGEVFVRNAGYNWIEATAEQRELLTFPLILVRGRNCCNPIGKVFKRVDQGEEDNLSYFYSVFSTYGQT